MKKEKIYVVLLEWCENSDDGKEIALVTSDLELAKQKFRELRDEEMASPKTYINPVTNIEKPWFVMDDTDTKFYHHGYFPDFCEIRILEFIDPKPIV